MARKLKDRDLNLLVPYHKKEQDKPGKGNMVKLAAFPVGALVVIGAVFGVISLRAYQLESETRQMENDLRGEQVQQSYQASTECRAQLGIYNTRKNLIEDAEKKLAQYPVLDQSVFAGLSTALGSAATIDSYSYSCTDGSLILQLVGNHAAQAPDLIDALKQTGLFQRVSYSGYSGDGQTYRMQVICMIKAGGQIE